MERCADLKVFLPCFIEYDKITFTAYEQYQVLIKSVAEANFSPRFNRFFFVQKYFFLKKVKVKIYKAIKGELVKALVYIALQCEGLVLILNNCLLPSGYCGLHNILIKTCAG